MTQSFATVIIMTGILLKFMQHFQGELLRVAVCGVYAAAVALALLGNSKVFGWYLPDYFKVWCIVCVAGLGFGIWQFVCLYYKLSGFEQIA